MQIIYGKIYVLIKTLRWNYNCENMIVHVRCGAFFLNHRVSLGLYHKTTVTMAVDGIKRHIEVVNQIIYRCLFRRPRALIFQTTAVFVFMFVVYQILFQSVTDSSWKSSGKGSIQAGKHPADGRRTNSDIWRNSSHKMSIVSRRASTNSGFGKHKSATTSNEADRLNIRDPDTFRHLIGDLDLPGPDGHHGDRIAYQNDMINIYANATANHKRKVKTILHVGYGNFVMGQTSFENCPVPECLLTDDLSQSADVLHMTEISYWQLMWNFLPKPSHQIWIAEHWESPMHDLIDTAAVDGLINWTVSYRRDSTVPVSYGRYYPIVGASTPDNNKRTKNYAAGKTKKVAWFVSNCNARNFRLQYAHLLSKYIQVDVYGKCGQLTCFRGDEKSCFEMLSRDYKFYLAFENSNCDQYITEKLSQNGLSHDILPIVMGARREDYASFAPTHSYIHVDDFTDPQQLADYLHLLDRNDTLYNEYFTWKGSWMNMVMDQNRWCRLCALLHWRDDVDYVSWYDDYRSWWNEACDRSPTLPWFQQNSAQTVTVFRVLLMLLVFSIAASIFLNVNGRRWRFLENRELAAAHLLQ